MTYEEIVAEVSDYTGISKQIVDRTYKAYWRAVREHITSLELKKDLTDEEFMELRPMEGHLSYTQRMQVRFL